ncbi:MAG: hypothetical protein ACRC2O_07000 [Chitinophagaceae bacterium]
MAQEQKTFKVSPGQKVFNAIPPKDRYTYSNFIPGIVYFKNNNVGGGSMNYDALVRGIEFIDANGDTVILDNLETIRNVVMANDTFVVEKVTLQQLAIKGNIRLAKSWVIMVSNHQREGAMGQVTDASVETFTSLSSSGNALKTMVAKDILTFKEHTTFYFGSKFGQFKLANKKNLMAGFGNHKKEISAYLEENIVNFLKEQDMRDLLDFLSTL